MDTALRASLLAGALTGAGGAVLFAAVHWFAIFPTWGTLVGLPFALLAGLALGWGFHALDRSGALPGGLAGGAAYGALMLLVLAPVEAVGALAPQPSLERLKLGAAMDGGALLAALLSAAPAGALAGWLLTRRRVASVALALAALATSVTVGHNIPFFAADARAPKMWAVMGLVALASGVLLAAARARLAPSEA
jgi:hypothetical protein